MPDQLKPKRVDREPIANDNLFEGKLPITKPNEFWTTVLFLLVIITAISLGIVVGWGSGRKATITPRVLRQSNAVSAQRIPVPVRTSSQDAATDSTDRVEPSSNIHDKAKSAPVPEGSLVVTENGKVIYRAPAGPGKLGRKQPASNLRLRELIRRVEPDYPPQARAQHIEGTVVLDVEVAEQGNVANTAVVSGDPLLTGAAVEAVRQWRYQPSPSGDTFQTRVELQFRLPVN